MCWGCWFASIAETWSVVTRSAWCRLGTILNHPIPRAIANFIDLELGIVYYSSYPRIIQYYVNIILYPSIWSYYPTISNYGIAKLALVHLQHPHREKHHENPYGFCFEKMNQKSSEIPSSIGSVLATEDHQKDVENRKSHRGSDVLNVHRWHGPGWWFGTWILFSHW